MPQDLQLSTLEGEASTDAIDRLSAEPRNAQPEAIPPPETRTPSRATPRPIRVRGRRDNEPALGVAHGVAQTPAHGPALPRDRAILIRLAKMRLLSLPQLQRLVFAGRHRTRLSYRLSALARQGWIRLWEEPLIRGGRPRYVVPTLAGLRFGLAQLERSQQPFRHAQLLATMLRNDRRLPIPLTDGVTPAFLNHQREVNDILISLGSSQGSTVTWASSWHRPFPNSFHGLRLPQPDFVVVVAEGDERSLILGEHDRGHESLAHFAEAKITRYRDLARQAAVLKELTGFDAFTVLVTVNDALAKNSEARIEKLRRAALEGFAANLFSFASSLPSTLGFLANLK